MPADRNDETDNFNGERAHNKRGTRLGPREEHERGNGEKESGWHHDQSGEFHSLSLFRMFEIAREGYRELMTPTD
jgi:hypothetical protein